ncbi:MAG: MvaI/BcnI restriction endonuclease family protein [Candidatus Tectomicrobia bacterium]|uniref:MvaI/BcnI restriction endonuclease family protein n=1 Tax=Tectimicrobiota bacterium TaxID=2528274 RepID=A0A933GPH5_UNCTE|nr:MvaI/BcnI restriction endonuclease family protein [Candidatus Tectomicrobia bacterium]
MKLYTKEQLIESMREIFHQGWHRSVKEMRDTRNDGAVGNTLEVLLGLRENNLPIPNASEWELKGQRSHSASLVTLKHIEPSPTGAKIVADLLLPLYGWKHKEAGKKYPKTEMSFRSTTSATSYTSRGFRIIVDKQQQKLRFVFDATKAHINEPVIASWLESVKMRGNLSPLHPEPYWGFEDLKYEIGSKIGNCFYVIADSKTEGAREFFLYKELYILSGFSFERFIQCVDEGAVLIDFDARTGHNHGTKFRIRQGHWRDLYSDVMRAI